MRGEGIPLGNKKGYYFMFNPSIIEATDEIADLLETDRTSILELGLSKVFVETIGELERQLENMHDGD